MKQDRSHLCLRSQRMVPSVTTRGSQRLTNE